jgi:hypothetical protein
MLPIKPAVYPLSAAVVTPREANKVEAAKKGTSLRDAVTLERDKNKPRENSGQQQDPEQQQADSEHNLHLYTSVGVELDIEGSITEIDVVA